MSGNSPGSASAFRAIFTAFDGHREVVAPPPTHVTRFRLPAACRSHPLSSTRRERVPVRLRPDRTGDDQRRDPLEVRKATLASVLAGVGHGIWFNDHIEGDGPTLFRHACKLGLEGIVSKRKDSPYRSGRSPDWLKSKNPACAAVKREAEEDWGRSRSRLF